MAGQTQKRGRPRDPARGEAIREATRALLAEAGYQGLTMVDVAERAGVAKTTIYRRWPTKAEMVLDALAEEVETGRLEESGDVVDDLRRVVLRFYRWMSDRDGELGVAPAMLLREAEVVDAFRERFVRPMREQAQALVVRAIEQERIRHDVKPVDLVDALAAPALYAVVAHEAPADEELAGRIFTLVMQGARKRA